MCILISFIVLFTSFSIFACSPMTAENMVTQSIMQTLVASEELRSLKVGTVTYEEKMGEQIRAVHAVFEVQKYGRKTSEQSIVFRFNENCDVIGSSGAVIKKVTL